MNAESFDEIAKQVRESGDILTIEMAKLKEAAEAGRLGKWVREGILDELRKRGLDIAGEMPDAQWEKVRIYRQGTGVAKLIQAFQEPGPEGDEALRSAAGNDAGEKIEQIRRLICE